MLGFQFVKFEPTDFVLQYRGGRAVREGVGLSFIYFTPTNSLVKIPIASIDVPFIFEEVTSDFQQVTIQGQITYRVEDPKKLSQLMNFTLTPNGKSYTSDDPKKLPQRLVNHAQVLTRNHLKSTPLKAVLSSTDSLVESLRQGLQEAAVIRSLGIEVLGFSILAIKPNPETARALEAEAREQILRQSDEAIYARRNAAVEQERAIKENELSTEIAVEVKKRQIRETQMEARKSVQQKRREIREAEMSTQIALEERKKELVGLASANAREEADVKAYGISAAMKALGGTDPRIIQALASSKMEPSQLISLAFKELAENSGKIGQLNVTPDLLKQLLNPSQHEG